MMKSNIAGSSFVFGITVCQNVPALVAPIFSAKEKRIHLKTPSKNKISNPDLFPLFD